MPDNDSLKEITISEMKNKFIIITCNKEEVVDKDVFIVDECAYNKEKLIKVGRANCWFVQDNYQFKR